MSEIRTVLDSVSRVLGLARELGVDNLAKQTSPARLTPTVLVDHEINLIDVNVRRNILHTALDMFTSYYILAVNLEATVGNVKARSILDKFSTNRSPTTSPGAGWLELYEGVGGESYQPMSIMELGAGLEDRGTNPDPTSGGGGDKHLRLYESNNTTPIAIGKTLTIELIIDGKSVPMNVTAQLNIMDVDRRSLTNLMSGSKLDNSMKGRFRRWWSLNEIDTLDYLLCLDMIRADRKALIQDTDNLYAAKRSKNTSSKIAALVSGIKDVNRSSSIIITTTSGALELETAMRGKLSRYNDRQKLFNDTNSLFLFVVDSRNESIKMYTNSIFESSIYTFDDIKAASTNPNAVNLNNAFRDFNEGRNPGL